MSFGSRLCWLFEDGDPAVELGGRGGGMVTVGPEPVEWLRLDGLNGLGNQGSSVCAGLFLGEGGRRRRGFVSCPLSQSLVRPYGWTRLLGLWATLAEKKRRGAGTGTGAVALKYSAIALGQAARL